MRGAAAESNFPFYFTTGKIEIQQESGMKMPHLQRKLKFLDKNPNIWGIMLPERWVLQRWAP